MDCPKCGKKLKDGAHYCLHCDKMLVGVGSKTLKTTYIANNIVNKTPDMATSIVNSTNFTVNFIRKCFPWVFAIMFWLTVIGGMIGGAKLMMGLNSLKNFTSYKYQESEDKTGAVILGGLLGLIGGFVFAVYSGGVVATILNMDVNLQYLADKEKAKG